MCDPLILSHIPAGDEREGEKERERERRKKERKRKRERDKEIKGIERQGVKL